MSERSDALRRVAKLQNQVKRMAEHRLALAEAERQAVEAAQRDLVAFVGDAPLAGKLASLVGVQRRRLGERQAVAEDDVGRESEAVREATRGLKIAERLAETVALEDRRLAERKAFERLLEEMAARRED